MTTWLRGILLSAAVLCAACGSDDDPNFGATASGDSASAPGAGGNGTSSSAGASGGAGGEVSAGAGGGGGSVGGTFPEHWPDGLDCSADAPFFVWPYDDDTFILRQSLCTNFEGPFLYLIFGEDRVLLEDTGTGDADTHAAVSAVITQWLARKGKPSIELVVAHSHSHGDHVGGDSQFAGQPNTTTIGTSVTAVASFFSITDWPNQIVTYDLGNRVLDVVPIPGHQTAHLAFFDRRDHLLLTGDTLYPGRLYVQDWDAYSASIDRLATFTATRTVTWVLGTHIEMNTSGKDYAMGAAKHPSEHVLELPYATFLELRDAVAGLGSTPAYQAHADFIIYPL